MITIDLLKISEAADSIQVDVSTEVSETITKVSVWDSSTYKRTTQVIDLSSLLAGTSEVESFEISLTDLGITKITGLYIIEFTSSEVTNNTQIGMVANLVPYYEYLNSRVLTISIDGCSVVNQCSSADALNFISTLIDTFRMTLVQNKILESVQIANALNELTGFCKECFSYEDALLLSGLGYDTVSNVITLN